MLWGFYGSELAGISFFYIVQLSEEFVWRTGGHELEAVLLAVGEALEVAGIMFAQFNDGFFRGLGKQLEAIGKVSANGGYPFL